MWKITLILIIFLTACQKPELVPLNNKCQYTDPYTSQKCQEEGTINTGSQILCQVHYYKIYYIQTQTNTQNVDTVEETTNTQVSNYDCQRSSSVTCGAKTKKGTSCKNKTLSCNGRCYLHGG
jgi:hypothetical protein